MSTLLRTPDARYAIGAAVGWLIYGVLYIAMLKIYDRHYAVAAAISWILVTAQDARPEALCVSGDTERIYQDFRFLGDGLDDVPALLFGSGDE